MKLNEIFDEQQFLIEMPYEDAKEAAMVLKSVFKKYMGLTFDMSQHLRNRVLDKGESGRKEHGDNLAKDHDRESDVTKQELYGIFNKMIKNKKIRGQILGAKQKGREFEATITDNDTDENVAFKVAYQNRDKFPLFRMITLKRKKNFKAYASDDARFYV
jgi:hypothetical protein